MLNVVYNMNVIYGRGVVVISELKVDIEVIRSLTQDGSRQMGKFDVKEIMTAQRYIFKVRNGEWPLKDWGGLWRMTNECTPTNLTASQAVQIATEYKNKYGLRGHIDKDNEKAVKFYNEFYGVDGSVWLVVADITPNIFEGDQEITFVVSDADEAVDHVLDHNGLPQRYHVPSSPVYTEEELDAIFDEDDEED